MEKKPMILVFAGPNGSGKSTITSVITPVGEYINADDIKKAVGCTDLEAAQIAEQRRNTCLDTKKDFTFETVLSTERNLNLLKKAKENGYFIKSFFVLTNSSDINVNRVKVRVATGGHDVPEDKIRARYDRSLNILPELIKVSDICNVCDNTEKIFRIFSKKKDTYRVWENKFWDKSRIENLTKVSDYSLMKTQKSSIDNPYYIPGITLEQAQVLKKEGIQFGYNVKEQIIAVNVQDKNKVMDIIAELRNKMSK